MDNSGQLRVKPMGGSVMEHSRAAAGPEAAAQYHHDELSLSTSAKSMQTGAQHCFLFLVAAKSRSMQVQSSSNSSRDPSGSGPPLNQRRLPWTVGPPCEAIRAAVSRRVLL